VNISDARAFFIALFIGALVGVERTQHRQDEPKSSAGLRTFILVAELGALTAWISRVLGSSALFIAGLVCVTAVLTAGDVVGRRHTEESAGMTTEIAGAVVFVLGGLTVLGYALLGVAMAIVTAALLAMKSALHEGVRHISRADLMATLRLLFAAFIVLPLLPDHPVDPWGALNPYKLWLLVILISGMSMVGYVAGRIAGPDRGTLLAAFFGGIASSTAVTLTFARQSRDQPELSKALVTGSLLAWTVMFARVIVLVGVLAGALKWSLIPTVMVPMGAMGLAGAAAAAFALYGHKNEPSPKAGDLGMRNPFRLTAAIKFALLFAAVLLASRLAQNYWPATGLYYISGIAGSTDVDTVTLSLLGMFSHGDIAARVVADGMVIAAIANTVVKLGLMAVLGSRTVARALVPGTLAIVATGIGMLVLFPA
jgi:uncharacterized membrane protein (DUF4010 family)